MEVVYCTGMINRGFHPKPDIDVAKRFSLNECNGEVVDEPPILY